MNKEVRWKQRFQNLKKSYEFLKEGLSLSSPDRFQEAGIIQSFEFTFELSWKTLKDFLEGKGSSISFARDVIKEAFAARLIKDGHLWIEMLEQRNALSHTYDRKQANDALNLIKSRYFPAIQQVYQELEKRCLD